MSEVGAPEAWQIQPALSFRRILLRGSSVQRAAEDAGLCLSGVLGPQEFDVSPS